MPALIKTGYDACTTASNHSFDKGAAGGDRTLKLLDQAGMKHAGTARTREEAATPTIVPVQGVKVALLSNLVAAHRQPASPKSEGLLVKFTFRKDGDRWKADAQYAPLLMTDTLPVRVLDVQRELAKPGLSKAKKARLELAERRTSETVGAGLKML